MKAREYRERSYDELKQIVGDLSQDLFNLKFQHATGQLDNVAKLTETKRKIATVHTIIREHELGIRQLVKGS